RKRISEVRSSMHDRWPQELRLADKRIRGLNGVFIQWRVIEVRAGQMNILHPVELGSVSSLMWFRPVRGRIPWISGTGNYRDIDSRLCQASNDPACPRRIPIRVEHRR